MRPAIRALKAHGICPMFGVCLCGAGKYIRSCPTTSADIRQPIREVDIARRASNYLSSVNVG
jgi:hypothetical protein